MNVYKCIVLSIFTSCLFLCSCGEVKEGAEKVTDEVTGLGPIKRGVKAKEQIKGIEKGIQQQQDALDAVDDIRNK